MTNPTLMKTAELAQAIKECVEKSDGATAYKTYYSPDVVTVESMEGPDGRADMTGIDACLKKSEQWHAMMETHAVEVSEPLVTESHFAMTYRFDITNRQTGHRMWMEELAVYTVKNGKIIREVFHYAPFGEGCM